MATTLQATPVLSAHMASLLYSRELSSWDQVADADLPVPLEYIKEDAYFRFLNRDRQEGLAQEDWFQAEQEQRAWFRGIILDEIISATNNDTAGTEVATYGQATGVSQSILRDEFPVEPLFRRNGVVPLEGIPAVSVTSTPFIRPLTADEQVRFQDRVLAVLCQTGEIIGDADTLQNLKRAVSESLYHGQPWRAIDGPGSDGPAYLASLNGVHD